MIKKFLCLSALSAVLLSSCVPARKLDECNEKRTACENELSALKTTNQSNEAKLKELNEQLTQNNKDIKILSNDTMQMGSEIRILEKKYDKLNTLNEELLDKYNKLLSGSEKDNAKLSGDLQTTQAALLKKQDELNALAAQLAQQKKDLDALSEQLKQREARVNELEAILKQKDQAAADLKKKLSDALGAFENKGLTITQKNGKIYVSMEESLLFASGKTDVQPKGVEALKGLAKVLDQNPDINIMVEGHTDDVPMKGAGEIKDNWDLSVMRATSVTKIILSSSPNIDPKRIAAAGRGEFFPLDPAKTPEARKKNRRTEIILTPKLDELLKVLGSN
ncbi:MAG TPA: OmpA family protein [Bacteroidia bacterium]|jgi:chemotaxis protein MotB|nr:OmpA family protein [Bacteroidia bacterium]